MTEQHDSGVRRLRRWLNGGGQPRLGRRRRTRPNLESLEFRCLLTSIVDFPTTTAHAAPNEITSGPAGSLWFTENNAGNIGAINATTHVVSEFAHSDRCLIVTLWDHDRIRRQRLVYR